MLLLPDRFGTGAGFPEEPGFGLTLGWSTELVA